MKLKNISDVEAKAMPHTGPSFSVLPGETSEEVDELCAKDLASSHPSVWELVGVKPTPKPKLKKES